MRFHSLVWGSVSRNFNWMIQACQFVMTDWLGVAPSVPRKMFEKM